MYADAEVHKAYDNLNECIDKLTLEDDTVDIGNTAQAEEELAEDLDVSEEKDIVTMARKPFGTYFSINLKHIVPCCDASCSVNPLYQPKFLDKLLETWLPLCPFWSSILRGE